MVAREHTNPSNGFCVSCRENAYVLLVPMDTHDSNLLRILEATNMFRTLLTELNRSDRPIDACWMHVFTTIEKQRMTEHTVEEDNWCFGLLEHGRKYGSCIEKSPNLRYMKGQNHFFFKILSTFFCCLWQQPFLSHLSLKVKNTISNKGSIFSLQWHGALHTVKSSVTCGLVYRTQGLTHQYVSASRLVSIQVQFAPIMIPHHNATFIGKGSREAGLQWCVRVVRGGRPVTLWPPQM